MSVAKAMVIIGFSQMRSPYCTMKKTPIKVPSPNIIHDKYDVIFFKQLYYLFEKQRQEQEKTANKIDKYREKMGREKRFSEVFSSITKSYNKFYYQKLVFMLALYYNVQITQKNLEKIYYIFIMLKNLKENYGYNTFDFTSKPEDVGLTYMILTGKQISVNIEIDSDAFRLLCQGPIIKDEEDFIELSSYKNAYFCNSIQIRNAYKIFKKKEISIFEPIEIISSYNELYVLSKGCIEVNTIKDKTSSPFFYDSNGKITLASGDSKRREILEEFAIYSKLGITLGKYEGNDEMWHPFLQ